jgi:hypothetical protein
MTSVAWQLVRKDLYLSRWIVIGSTLAGLLSLAVAPLSQVALYVGAISFICVLVVLNVFLVMAGVVQEKKDRVLLFVLSLPISTTQYTVAKMVASFTTFFVPWVVLTAASLVTIAASDIPNGLMPPAVAVSAYLLCYYCALLAAGMVAQGIGWITAAIVAGNVSINFVIPLVFRLPSISASASGATAVWGGDLIAVLVLEAAFCAAALGLVYVVQSHRRDFV